DFTAALVLQASPDLRFKRASRVENACATGSAAVHQGLKAIAAKTARILLVVGAEQMTTTPAAVNRRNLVKAAYVRAEGLMGGGENRTKPGQGVLCARGSRYRRRLRRHFRPDCRALLPALGRPIRCARAHCRQES